MGLKVNLANLTILLGSKYWFFKPSCRQGYSPRFGNFLLDMGSAEAKNAEFPKETLYQWLMPKSS